MLQLFLRRQKMEVFDDVKFYYGFILGVIVVGFYLRSLLTTKF